MNCPFCNINAEITRIIKETELYFVALSNPRLVPGHLLVIPKRHVEKLSELTKDERDGIFEAVISLEEEILDKYSTGCDVRINYRPFQKQGWVKINHLHFHLQPREFEDKLYQKCQVYENGLWTELTKEEMDQFSNLFK